MSDDRPALNLPKLAELPGRLRLPIGAFLVGMLVFYGFAQLKVITAVGDGRTLPGVTAILHRYHGDPSKTKLHLALDSSLAESDPRRMYGWLGADDAERAGNRRVMIDWVGRGALQAEWPTVAPIFGKCTGCHSATAEGSGTRRDLPFDTYEDTRAVTKGDDGMGFAELATTSHNHLFGFLVGALLVSVVFGLTRWRGPLATALVVGAFAGAILDVVAWWLTKFVGSPFHYLVFLGGLAFGLCLSAMVVLALDEVLLAGRFGRVLARPLARLHLARREGG